MYTLSTNTIVTPTVTITSSTHSLQPLQVQRRNGILEADGWEAIDISIPYAYNDEQFYYDEKRGFILGVSREGFLALLNATPNDLARAINRVFELTEFQTLVSYGKLHSSHKAMRSGMLKMAFNPDAPFKPRIKRRKFSISPTGQIRSYSLDHPRTSRGYHGEQVSRVSSPHPTMEKANSPEENLFQTYRNAVLSLHNRLV